MARMSELIRLANPFGPRKSESLSATIIRNISVVLALTLVLSGLLTYWQAATKVETEVGAALSIAEKTVRMLKACVPAAVPGIAFLSGGQGDEEATANLDAMNRLGDLPWRLTFSYGRALQAAPQKAWSGKAENVAAAQAAFSHRAKMNGLATAGEWSPSMEKEAVLA